MAALSWHLLLGLRFEAQRCLENPRRFIPRGSADKVAESVKALTANGELHTIAAFGLIDRDVKTVEELSALAAQDIHALPFAEVENFLCNEKMVRAVAAALALDPDTAVRTVTEYISRALTEELEVQIVLTAARRIRYHLSCYSPASQDRAGLKQGIDTLVASLDLPSTVGEAEATLRGALTNAKLDDLLKVYNRKSLADRISVCFGLKHGEYVPLVLRLLTGKDSAAYVDLLRSYLPK